MKSPKFAFFTAGGANNYSWKNSVCSKFFQGPRVFLKNSFFFYKSKAHVLCLTIKTQHIQTAAVQELEYHYVKTIMEHPSA